MVVQLIALSLMPAAGVHYAHLFSIQSKSLYMYVYVHMYIKAHTEYNLLPCTYVATYIYCTIKKCFGISHFDIACIFSGKKYFMCSEKPMILMVL